MLHVTLKPSEWSPSGVKREPAEVRTGWQLQHVPVWAALTNCQQGGRKKRRNDKTARIWASELMLSRNGVATCCWIDLLVWIKRRLVSRSGQQRRFFSPPTATITRQLISSDTFIPPAVTRLILQPHVRRWMKDVVVVTVSVPETRKVGGKLNTHGTFRKVQLQPFSAPKFCVDRTLLARDA